MQTDIPPGIVFWLILVVLVLMWCFGFNVVGR